MKNVDDNDLSSTYHIWLYQSAKTDLTCLYLLLQILTVILNNNNIRTKDFGELLEIFYENKYSVGDYWEKRVQLLENGDEIINNISNQIVLLIICIINLGTVTLSEEKVF